MAKRKGEEEEPINASNDTLQVNLLAQTRMQTKRACKNEEKSYGLEKSRDIKEACNTKKFYRDR